MLRGIPRLMVSDNMLLLVMQYFNYFQVFKGNKTKVSEKNNYFVMKIPIKSQEPQKGP